MEVLYTYSPQNPSPFSKPPKKNFKNIKELKKKGTGVDCPGVDLRLAGNTWTIYPYPFFFEFFFSYPPLFVQVVKSWWLAPTNAYPSQTLLKNFKHP
jgi:hypothetical protein